MAEPRDTSQEAPTGARTYANPVFDRDFPDPNVIRASDGWFYAYATQGLGEKPVVNIQVARSPDLVSWEYLGEAMPDKPPWARSTQDLWAPHVVEHAGTFYMYYSAQPDDPPIPGEPDDPALCLAVATSPVPAGPFVDAGAPMYCGPSTSDIDPDVFRDPASGAWYCYWGSGGDIVVRRLADDLLGFDPDDELTVLLRGWTADPRIDYEHGIEGPYVVERDGWYYLFYSGDRTWTWPPRYAAMVARARSPVGPFRRHAEETGAGNSIVVADGERWRGPGHNSVVRDDAGDDWIVYHAIDERRPWLFEGQVRRVMLMDRLDYSDGWPAVAGAVPGTTGLRAPSVRR